MKKRLLCIIVAMLMVLPLVLVSCGSQDDKDKMKEIILGSDSDKPIDKAYTLSLWIPTDAITVKGQTKDLSELTQQQKDQLLKSYPDVYEFLKRVDDVEDAINEILIGRSYYTKIDIVPVNNEYYEEAIAERFAAMDAVSNPGDMNTLGASTAYENEVVEELVGSKVLYDLLYRPVDDNQLDIFLIRDYGEYSGYGQYISYIDSNYIIPLNDPQNGNYISTTGSYASINKLIRSQFLEELKVNNLIYALPNNHLYADQYQYILVNKELVDSYDEYNVDDMSDIYSCTDFINSVGNSGLQNVVPFVASFDDLAGYNYIDKNLGFGGITSTADDGNTVFNIESIFSNEEFSKYVKMYKELQDKNYVKTDLADGEVAAVRIFNGTSLEAQEYADEYYLIKTAAPVADTSDVYASMFAISSFSLSYDRSMKILNLLQSDTKIRTLLQYGIEGEDYTVAVETVDGKDIEKINIKDDTYYKMNILYTGNEYYTYPGDNTEIDDWDYVKETNLDVIINPFIRFDYYLENGNLTASEKQFIIEHKDEFYALILETYEQIASMTLSEYEAFLEVYNTDFDSKESALKALKEQIAELSSIQENIDKKNQEIADERAKMTANGDMARYEELVQKLDNANKRIDEISAEFAAGIFDNFDEQMQLYNDVLIIEGEINSVAERLIALENELAELIENQKTADAKIVELNDKCDVIIQEIETIKSINVNAYELKTSDNYAKLLEIYNKVLTLY
ncbi:MAG: hypothetical protein IJ437_02985 [Clostridia bacterium]|nr:hypothetical protein [Clostridia bacterium]